MKKKKDKGVKDSSLGSQLTKAKKWYDDIAVRSSDLLQRLGVSREEVDNLFANPKNRPAEWERLQAQQQEWENRLYSIIGKKAKQKKQKQKKEKEAKKRRGKMRGGRKGWMKM